MCATLPLGVTRPKRWRNESEESNTVYDRRNVCRVSAGESVLLLTLKRVSRLEWPEELFYFQTRPIKNASMWVVLEWFNKCMLYTPWVTDPSRISLYIFRCVCWVVSGVRPCNHSICFEQRRAVFSCERSLQTKPAEVSFVGTILYHQNNVAPFQASYCCCYWFQNLAFEGRVSFKRTNI